MKITIVETAHHFLYLPVHYALCAQCFGYLPNKYVLNLISANPKTDRAAYRMLLRGRDPGHNYIGFAVGDPAELLHDQDSHLKSPVVLAGLITNSSFWAVDRRSHKIRVLSDLAAFDRIIAFPEGTTSHGIATRIYRDANRTPDIEPVEPGSELTELTFSQKGTVALTPDVLGLSLLETEHKDTYHVDLALGKTPEYNNVLVTALLSRDDVVNDYPDLVQGLLAAIQRSMLLVRFADPDVIKFAKDDQGKDEEMIITALRRAADAQVFPSTIEVSKAHWENLGRAAADAANRQHNEQESDRVRAKYDTAVAPYGHHVVRAIRECILPRFKDNSLNETTSEHFLLRMFEGGFYGFASGILLLAAWAESPLISIGVAHLAIVAGLILRIHPMNRAVSIIQLFWLLAGLLCLIWLWTEQPSDQSWWKTLLMTWVAWVGVEIGILLKAVGVFVKK